MAPALTLAVAMAAGFVGAMGGVGGGIVLIPALTFLGMDIKKAIALSMLSVIATSSGAASAYVRDRLTNLKVGMFLEVFTILGAPIGASLTAVLPRKPLFLLLGFLLLGSALTLYLRNRRAKPPAQDQDRFSAWFELEGSYPERPGEMVSYKVVRAYWGGPLMFLAGVTAGLLGIGAGALKVLIFDLVMGLPTKVSTTTSNLVIGVTALAGSSVYFAEGLIDAGAAVPVILGILAGALAGTRLLVRLKGQTIRWFFMGLLVVLSIQIMVRGLSASPQ